MDRRFFTWLMLTTALGFFYLSVRQQQMAKPQPEVAKQAVPNADPLLRNPAVPGADDAARDPLLTPDGDAELANADVVDGDASVDDDALVGDTAQADSASDSTTSQSAATETDSEKPPRPAEIGSAAEKSDAEKALDKPQNPPTAVTLGDPDKGYKLQVTLTSRGAGVEQAELVERTSKGKLRYRSLEHDGGYLGYLGLAETSRGLKIRTLPASTAAASASGIEGGLQVGDVLVELNGSPTLTRLGVEQILADTKPGQSVPFVVERQAAGKVQRLEGTVQLSEAPLDVLRMMPGHSEVVAGNLHRPGLLTTVGSIGGTQIPVGLYALPALQDTLDADWAVHPLEVSGGQGVEFRLPLDSFLAGTGRPQKLDLVKRYRLYPLDETHDGYLLDLETVIINRNEQDVSLSFRQEGLPGLTLEGWWYTIKISPHMFAGAGQRDVIYDTLSGDHQIATTRSVVDKARKTEADMLAKYGQRPLRAPVGMPTILLSESEPAEVRSLSYIGVDAPYFTASILPHPQDEDALSNLRGAAAFAVTHSPERIDKAQLQATNTSFWFDTEEQLVPAGGEFSQRYQVFIGPKTPVVLATHGLGRAIEYGWFPWIAKPLSAILHFFHAIVGNYGLAIVMLTVMVRGSMFPLGRKAAINAQRMQELQPEMKRINELYKDDMEKRAKAMQEVYAKHNFKPLAGCLPMFIQLPIFIGLYRCLSVDLSLRQEPLIPGVSWASNLAGPDQLLNWSQWSWMPEFIVGRGTGWLGPYFNILPMVTVLLFLLQQKMLMPKATDDQTRMTQNMMQVMTIFMGVMFFKVPSGLCIYFITSSAWSLVERKLVKRSMPPPKANQPAVPQLPLPSGNGTSKAPPARSNPKDRRKGQAEPAKPLSRFEEMKRMLEKPAVKSTTQRGSRKEKKPKR